MKCRFCNTDLHHEFVDLVASPPSNAYLTQTQLNEPETYFPLKLFTCHNCFLVQIDEYQKSSAIFNQDYAYFSSFSSSWLDHAKKYVDMISNRLNLNQDSKVIEIASNDGYLLQYFKAKNIPCLGVEPTASTAKASRDNHQLDVIEDFFGERLAKTLNQADLIIGNNVFAHVPDLHDFVKGLKIALKLSGTITLEFPHVLQLIKHNQFDTIYHEHFSYFSLITVQQIFEANQMQIVDVEELETHGGSLRIYIQHQNNDNIISKKIDEILNKEKSFGLNHIETYLNFQNQANTVKYQLLRFLLQAKSEGKSVVAYGAAAKGNTLLNYCGIKPDLIDYVVDKNPHKQNKFLPASHLPIFDPSKIDETKPDYILILPWNIQNEVMKQLEYVSKWGSQFVIPIPELKII